MSKWVNKELFENFVNEKLSEKEAGSGNLRSAIVWTTPKAGTADKANVYEGRFLPDLDGCFGKKYYYHMFQVGDSFKFVFCPKSHDFEAFCPFCSITSKLYKGGDADKKLASQYKRKTKYVSNFFIVNDPRDTEQNDEEKKNGGKVKIYEYPEKVNAKIKEELRDAVNGLGYLIYEPDAEGYNFILKVKSTKPMENGKTFPDYSDSTFARRATALGSEKEIDAIMNSTHSINEYLKSLEQTDKQIYDLLKSEFLFDMIETEWNKYKKVSFKEDEKAVSLDPNDGKGDETPSAKNDEDDIDLNLDDIEIDLGEDDVPF